MTTLQDDSFRLNPITLVLILQLPSTGFKCGVVVGPPHSPLALCKGSTITIGVAGKVPVATPDIHISCHIEYAPTYIDVQL